jgi:hypothetical protein
MNSYQPISKTLTDRRTLVQLFIAAVVLGLGVNILSSAIADMYADAIFALWILAFSLILLGLALIARQTIPSRRMEKILSGFVVFHRGTSDLIEVPRYGYGEDLTSYLEGLFSENSAPKILWETDPVNKGHEFNADTKRWRKRQTEAGQLLVEATEYYVLEKLSTHLTDYFNQTGLDSKRLKDFAREDIADIVFKNRFLDTFSRPMKERAAFATDSNSHSNDAEHIVASFGPNGVRFSRFDLTLPLGAKVQSLSANSISIDTPKFSLTIDVDFSGFNTNLPRGFEKLYLGCADFSDLSAYKIILKTHVEFKRWSLLTRTAWEYHSWLDSFLQELVLDFDQDAFFSSIQWESAITVARIVERTITSKQSTVHATPPDSAHV